jgi:hypothetical protein
MNPLAILSAKYVGLATAVVLDWYQMQVCDKAAPAGTCHRRLIFRCLLSVCIGASRLCFDSSDMADCCRLTSIFEWLRYTGKPVDPDLAGAHTAP